MTELSQNNKRIVKNTLMLYIRMLFVMIVSLYTVRIVLNVLGEEDYGIYNVVGGVILMFSFLSRTLASASQRYFAFEIGQKNYIRLSETFCVTLILYFFSGILIIILGETIGLWFLHNKMTIPECRMGVVNWIFHFSIISFCITIMATPYQAIIIAREKMGIYAMAGILEVSMTLLFAFALTYVTYDKLFVYGLLMLTINLLVNMIYVVYAIIHFKESRFHFYWEKALAKQIVSYSGWNMYGAIANVVRSQGINLLINVYFNPVINAARGLAFQINNAVTSFASNFYTAFRPQVTKKYSAGDLPSTMNLVFSSSKFSYFLILFVAVPAMFYSDDILHVWLVSVPDYTVLFVRLTIIVAMIDAISNPLMTLAQATGEVKIYQLIIGTLLLLNLPISWIFLRQGFPAEYTLYVAIAIALISLFARIEILKKQVNFPAMLYLKEVFASLIMSTIVCSLVTFCIYKFLEKFNNNFTILTLSIASSVFACCVIIYYVGFNKKERKLFIDFILSKLHLKKS